MSELTWKQMHEAAVDQCVSLAAQLEASRKEVVMLREALIAHQQARKYSTTYGHLPDALEDCAQAWQNVDETVDKALASTTPDKGQSKNTGESSIH